MAYKIKQKFDDANGTYLEVGKWEQKNGKTKFIPEGYYGNPTSKTFKKAEKFLKEQK